ncbi:MAG: PH domain-containing protein, partial [Planctomycetota bacterium]
MTSESSSPQAEGVQRTETEAAAPTDRALDERLLRGPQRLHPSSILFGVFKNVRQFFVAFFFAIFLASSGNRIGAWIAGAALLPATIKTIVDYFRLRFEIVDGELRVHEGWLMRRDRAVPIERIQNLDLVQNPLHRLLGVAGVRVETASGKEPEAVLNVLRLEDIERLRNSLFQGATAAKTDVSPERLIDGPAEHAETSSLATAEKLTSDELSTMPSTVLTASVLRLAIYGMLSLRGLVAVPLLFGLYFQFQPGDWFDYRSIRGFMPDPSFFENGWLTGVLLPVGVIVSIGIASAIWFVTRFYGYELRRRGDDLQIAFGLLTRVSATVPRRRIQFVSVQQNLWARWLGLANIRIETAGGATGEGVDPAAAVARRWFVPVVAIADVPRILNELRDELGSTWERTEWRRLSPRTFRRLLIIAAVESVIASVCGYFVWRPWGVSLGLIAFLLLAFRAKRYANSQRVFCGDGRISFRQGLWTRR